MRNEDDFITDCLDNNAAPVLPVRGWRSASRSFVDGDDNAPSVRPEAPADAKAGTVTASRGLPMTIEGGDSGSKRERANADATNALLRAAIERLDAQR